MIENIKELTNDELELKMHTLKIQSNEAWAAFEKDEKKVSNEVKEFIKSLVWDKGLELLTCHSHLDWTTTYNGNHVWYISTSISFKRQDTDKIDYDFGSTIDLYIYKDRLEMNYGTCGTYSSKDLGQLSRIHLVYNLWEHEKELLEKVNNIINIENRLKANRIDVDINKIKNELDARKKDLKKKEILDQLKPDKYLAFCEHKYLTSYYDDTLHKYIREHPIIKYSDIEKIVSITKKNVVTIDVWNTRHFNNLEQTIKYLIDGRCTILDEPKDYDEIREE